MTDPIKLKTKTIRGAHDGPHLLITAGVHGDEFEPMAAVRRLGGEIDAAALRGHVSLVPVVNEAAFEAGDRWAQDELDLARTCPGSAVGSITQRTAHAVSQMIVGADYYIDLHTGGRIMSVLPFCGYPMSVSAKTLDVSRRMAQAFNLPIVWSTEGRKPGRTLSISRDHDIPSIYAEYEGGGRYNSAGTADYVAGCLNVMGELGMIDRTSPSSRIEHLVEDERSDSAHMQIQNPSPVAGFFESAVELGQRVEPGDALGTVSDPLGHRVETVRSTQCGLVIVLRTICRVAKDDALAVIVEVDRPYGG